MLCHHFAKGNNFPDFVYASLEDEALPEWGLNSGHMA